MRKTNKQQTLSTDGIFHKFNNSKNKCDILWEALDYMQQYNGRSRCDCIALAMGYQDITGEGKYTLISGE